MPINQLPQLHTRQPQKSCHQHTSQHTSQHRKMAPNPNLPSPLPLRPRQLPAALPASKNSASLRVKAASSAARSPSPPPISAGGCSVAPSSPPSSFIGPQDTHSMDPPPPTFTPNSPSPLPQKPQQLPAALPASTAQPPCAPKQPRAQPDSHPHHPHSVLGRRECSLPTGWSTACCRCRHPMRQRHLCALSLRLGQLPRLLLLYRQQRLPAVQRGCCAQYRRQDRAGACRRAAA